ncbi:MAG: aminopeptidase P family protein [Bacilli bacterium]|nr:aminopeptidase P family protein [Bacilli bacterium]
MLTVQEIQSKIKLLGADAWIIVDYENQNPTLVKLLGSRMLTRKIFLVLPKAGKPYLIVHRIDTIYLHDIEDQFDLRIYQTWQEMLDLERQSFASYKKVLMDVSESGLLPRISLADHGSVSFVSSLGIEIASSGDLQQYMTAVLSEESLQSQLKACKTCLKIKDEAFRLIALKIQQNGISDELEIQRYIAHRFDEEGMVYDEPPLVAIGPNASDPHYTPTEQAHSSIKEGDLVLVDMWAKYKEPGSVYADITWMGYVGKEVPKEYQERFAIVKGARDAAISFLQKELPLRPVHAFEADDAARQYIAERGYGKYFLHRLGHNIADGVSPHGPGANLDNYESHDTRLLLENTSFSDEPGIYAPDFGMRSETDLHIHNGQLVIAGGLQEEVIAIMNLL